MPKTDINTLAASPSRSKARWTPRQTPQSVLDCSVEGTDSAMYRKWYV